MSRDPIADYNAEQERRRATAAPQVNDARNSAGRFDLIERRKQQEQERIEAHKRAEVVSLLTRTKGRAPTEAEIAVALKR